MLWQTIVTQHWSFKSPQRIDFHSFIVTFFEFRYLRIIQTPINLRLMENALDRGFVNATIEEPLRILNPLEAFFVFRLGRINQKGGQYEKIAFFDTGYRCMQLACVLDVRTTWGICR
jgi:hypothetical protein